MTNETTKHGDKTMTGLEIEYCTNGEWLDLIDAPWREEAAAEWCDLVSGRIDDYFGESVATRAKGNRITFHGWNGAHFSRKGSGLGTFSHIRDADWQRVCEIADDAADEVREVWAVRVEALG